VVYGLPLYFGDSVGDGGHQLFRHHFVKHVFRLGDVDDLEDFPVGGDLLPVAVKVKERTHC
jgi:hypothetical protein